MYGLRVLGGTVGLALPRSSSTGSAVLVFRLADWTGVVSTDAVRPA